MGYSYSVQYVPNKNRTSVRKTYRLACDHCGKAEGVRKRKCPHTVTSFSLRAPAGAPAFLTLPFCPAPALCGPCLKALGGIKKLHACCEEPARVRQVKENEITERLGRGDAQVVCRRGDWAAGVPKGYVEAKYRNRYGVEFTWLLQEGYSPDWMSEIHPEHVGCAL